MVYFCLLSATALCAAQIGAFPIVAIARIQRRWLRGALWMCGALPPLLIVAAAVAMGEFYYLYLNLSMHVPFAAGLVSALVLACFSSYMIGGLLSVIGWPAGIRRMRWWLLIKTTGGLVAILIVLLVIQDFELRSRFEAMNEGAQRLADSLTPPAVDPDENAAIFYQRAITAAAQFGQWRKSAEYETARDCEFKSAESGAFLAPFEAIIADLRSGAALEKCRFDDEFVELDTPFDEQKRDILFELLILLSDSAAHESWLGNQTRAWQDVLSMQRVQHHALLDPRGYSAKDQHFYERRIEVAISRVINNEFPVDRALVERVIAKPFDLASLIQNSVVWSEAANNLLVSQFYLGSLPKQVKAETGMNESLLYRILLPPLARLRSGRDDLSASQARFESLRRVAKAARTNSETFETNYYAQPFGLLTEVHGGMAGPICIDSALLARQARKMNNLILSATLYRMDKGRYPQTMDELVGGDRAVAPADIFLKPYRDGLIIYEARDAGLHAEENLHENLGYLSWTIFLGDAHDEYASPD